MIKINSQEYYDWLSKFEARHTTDDCYTPPEIYDAVSGWVAERYELDQRNFVRPFVPNGDYQAVEYNDTDIVVDNPPFSILSKIIQFYVQKDVKFFLFAPGLTVVTANRLSCCCTLCVGVPITYDNGASVSTSFLTNLEDAQVKSDPSLYRTVKTANDERMRRINKQLPKYKYPDNVLTAAMLNYMSAHNTEFAVKNTDCCYVGMLDAQKPLKKGIFGGGLLLSEKAAAEKAAAEKAAAEKAAAEKAAAEKAAAIVWELSGREREIVRNLG